MAKFVNISNHPSSKWTDEQRTAALAMGCSKIDDVAFPNVDPHADPAAIADLAQDMFSRVCAGATDEYQMICHVMGETGFVFAFVTAAKARGIRCVHSTTERIAVDVKNPDGTVTKTATFKFVQFRTF